jgi:two-component system chemotaxis response regulator CheY
MDKKILVVDDSRFMRTIITNILKSYDMTNIEYASNGLEAIEKYKNDKYTFVTMDITMDKMNGLDALKEIKKIDPDARVIMVSAMGQKSLIMEAIKYGALDFVIKPFDKRTIEDAMSKLKNIKQ